MYDFRDDRDLIKFKERLQQARKDMNYRQDTFAEALHFSSRSSVGNWESVKSNSIPTLENFVAVCNVLQVDPNYLLGVNDFPSEENHAISKVIGIAEDNVLQMRTDKEASSFIDFILSAAELSELLRRIKQICYYGMISEAQETTFTPEALKRIQTAFDEFYRNVFPLDMNIDRFAQYIQKEFKWQPEKISIDKYIFSVITDNEYNNILFDHPGFEEKTDSEKYDILIWDIASTSYEYMLGQPIMELAEQEITKALNGIVKRYINSQVQNFIKRPRKNFIP